MINSQRRFCYRITHIENLPLILQHGIITRLHPNVNVGYTEIGNPEIIDVRSQTQVRIPRYGTIGDYVPFYFTPRSMMLYNIITGFRHPVVPRRNQNEILVIRCVINDLSQLSRWFFTDGHASDMATNHFNDLNMLNNIDWNCIQNSNFSKSDGDYDRPRRYQAEFLVYREVPVRAIESLHVASEDAANYAMNHVANNLNLAVHISREYFF